MIPAAALLVLAGLGLFVAGVLTGVSAWYWACVGACGLAVVLLVLARRRTPAAAPAPAGDARPSGPPAATGQAPAAPARHAPAPPPDERPAAAEDPAGTGGPRDTARPAAPPASTGAADASGDPAEEDVEVTDLLIVVDLTDEVLVVDEHPRYHLGDCRWLTGRETVPLPVGEARADGFTPCSVCGPDRYLAGVERARRAARRD
ncbi:hypothetical protein SAMN05660690_3440 [Geodermatophilus telluris]|uniref:Uncharacterized protein n=1 Tax=Geodermatophilus telluris TaxID=1190417 RepID=A0A1G6S433_9ACTN|nr:hypothetical protein [Geodermatophilus telluris]SDD11670.1 hypothetical protein SAMN05660690_3440 [Geodermatophilus telluris]